MMREADDRAKQRLLSAASTQVPAARARAHSHQRPNSNKYVIDINILIAIRRTSACRLCGYRHRLGLEEAEW
jgi:hypothetical protein